MGKETKALYSTLIKMLNEERTRKPPENKPLDYITQQAIAGADKLKGRDYRSLGDDGNMFFDFELPAEQQKKRAMAYNANQTGTFALAGGGAAGGTKAHGLQDKFLKDKFARDTAQNFQNNIQGAASNIRGGLATAAGGVSDANAQEINRRMAVMNSFGDLYKFKKGTNSQGGMLGSIIGAGAGVASAAITKW